MLVSFSCVASYWHRNNFAS